MPIEQNKATFHHQGTKTPSKAKTNIYSFSLSLFLVSWCLGGEIGLY